MRVHHRWSTSELSDTVGGAARCVYLSGKENEQEHVSLPHSPISYIIVMRDGEHVPSLHHTFEAQ